MTATFSPRQIKRGLLLFWTVYFLLVLATNLADGLKSLRILPAGWVFASGNFGLMIKVTRIYNIPHWFVGLLFLGVCLWETAAVYCFWRAFRDFRGVTREGMSVVYRAFAASLGLWAAFVIADEFLIVYEQGGLEGAHLLLFITHLVTLMAIRLLPDE